MALAPTRLALVRCSHAAAMAVLHARRSHGLRLANTADIFARHGNSLGWVGGQYYCGDGFTKALDKGSFIKFRDVMMNNHSPLREALAAAVCQMHGDAKRMAKRLAQQL